MFNTISRARKSEEGFTLIELLIVIVVLGILAAIVLFAVGSARDDSILSSCKAEHRVIETAQEAYKADKGVYATSLADPELNLRSTPKLLQLTAASTTASFDTEAIAGKDCVGKAYKD